MSDKTRTDEVFPYEYVGGGYFRMKGVKKGEPAPTLHGEQVPQFFQAQIARLTAERNALQKAAKDAIKEAEFLRTGTWNVAGDRACRFIIEGLSRALNPEGADHAD